MTSQLFGRSDTAEEIEAAGKVFGERYNGRYHLPLLPGEKGIKSVKRGQVADWVPRGVQSATNLAGSIVETRMLGIWERERSQMGLAVRPDLVERLAFVVRQARTRGMLADPPVDIFGAGVRLADVAPDLVKELTLIHDEAKQAAGGDAAAQQGTNRHDVWEQRAPGQDGAVGQLFGTPQINAQIEALERLLAENNLIRVPGLQERTVRNVALRAAGRFDDILQDTVTGELFMADLKTKRRQFYSYLEVRIQLAVYASAEWMLDPIELCYIPGPKGYVSQQWAIMLHMPADGAPASLKPVNLTKGIAHAHLARQVCDARSEAKNVEAHAEANDWSAFQQLRARSKI